MYSVVLLAAMTAGGQTPGHHGCYACGGCYGSCYGNYGVEGYNCYGGYYGAGYGDFHGCNGCCGAYSCAGAWGGYSCCGGYPWDWSSSGCNGCWGSYGVASPYFVEPPPAVVPINPPVNPKPGDTTKPPTKPGDTTKPPESLAPTRARLLVDVPPDARVFIDDNAMKATSEHRSYQTPDLEPGQTYYYEVRVEAQRDGKPVSETRRVLLRAGQEVRADFTDITTTSTALSK